MTLIPDGDGNITVLGADKMSKQTNDMWHALGPWVLAPPGWGSKYRRELFAIAILHDQSINEWVVVADGDDPSVWAAIDPLNTGVKPKDMKATYRFWSVDYEYTDSEAKKVKGTRHITFSKLDIPNWDIVQTILVPDPELGNVNADIKKATPSVHKNIAGYDLTTDIEADNEEIKEK